MVFHVSLLTSANHALRGPSASGCLRQKARSVPRLTTRIRFLYSYLNLLPFWEQAPDGPTLGSDNWSVGLRGGTGGSFRCYRRASYAARRAPFHLTGTLAPGKSALASSAVDSRVPPRSSMRCASS